MIDKVALLKRPHMPVGFADLLVAVEAVHLLQGSKDLLLPDQEFILLPSIDGSAIRVFRPFRYAAYKLLNSLPLQLFA